MHAHSLNIVFLHHRNDVVSCGERVAKQWRGCCRRDCHALSRMGSTRMAPNGGRGKESSDVHTLLRDVAPLTHTPASGHASRCPLTVCHLNMSAPASHWTLFLQAVFRMLRLLQ